MNDMQIIKFVGKLKLTALFIVDNVAVDSIKSISLLSDSFFFEVFNSVVVKLTSSSSVASLNPEPFKEI
jgi:hypothetical protein